jgi:peroxiredoxin
MTTAATNAQRPRPREPAPELDVSLVGGGAFRLADRRPRTFTMVVFFRGLHCPVCQAQLRELDRRLDELTARGIDVVAVSAETRERAERLVVGWNLRHLRVAYALEEETMRSWGLFVSRGMGDSEPALFNEPGLFLIDADGRVYYTSILSMPVGRPRLDDLLAGVDWWLEHDYPARGEA